MLEVIKIMSEIMLQQCGFICISATLTWSYVRTYMIIKMRQKSLDSKIINTYLLFTKIATYLMRTSKFQGVTLVYCMEQIRDALTIRSLSKISYIKKFYKSVSDQYQFGICIK